MTERHELATRAEELRQAFDRTFSEPVARTSVEVGEFLLLQLGSMRRAVPLSEVSGLHVDRHVTPLPDSAPELLGISGFRGAILPVYDLQVVLGQGKAARPRWMITAAAASLAFAFDDMLGHRRISLRDIRLEAPNDQSDGRNRRFIPADDGRGHHLVIDLKGVIEIVMRRVSAKAKGEGN
jgi:chemotaxis signal transduction protein